MKSILTLVFGVFTCCLSFGQVKDQLRNLSLEAGMHLGQVIKHSPKFKPNTDGFTTAAELNFVKKTYGKREWQRVRNYPSFGVALSYFHYDNAKVLGSSFNIMPHFTFDIADTKRFYMQYRIGIGMSFMTKSYNKVTNPDNNVIGSILNNTTALRLNAGYRITPNIGVFSAFSLSHFSNGGIQLPNLGINVASLQLGVRYTPYPVDKKDFIKRDSLPARSRRLHGLINTGYSVNEKGAPDGPKYPIYILSGEAGYYVSRAHRLTLGVQWEYHSRFYYFSSYTSTQTEQERNKQATRYSAIFGDEIFYGNISLITSVGYYLNHPATPAKFFFRLGARYYFINTKYFRANISAYLKAHYATAEYGAIGLGFSF